MKTTAFTVRADSRQAAIWQRWAAAEGFDAVGRWLSAAADSYVKARVKAGLPLPLSWRSGTFHAILATGELVTVRGKLAPPYGYFEGSEQGPTFGIGKRRFTLVHMPSKAIVATLRYAGDCKSLGAELARRNVNFGGNEPPEDPAPVIERFK